MIIGVKLGGNAEGERGVEIIAGPLAFDMLRKRISSAEGFGL